MFALHICGKKLTGNIIGTLIGRGFKFNFVSRILILFLEGLGKQIDECANATYRYIVILVSPCAAIGATIGLLVIISGCIGTLC